jgi:hypothetical protein
MTTADNPALFGLVHWDAWVAWREDDRGRCVACGGSDDHATAVEIARATGASHVLPRGQWPALGWGGRVPPAE